jgi:glutamate-1-semialdehyde 2,1-aminomutase
MKRYTRSQELFERAYRVLAGGVSSEFRKFSLPHPLFYTHAYGSRIVDVDGNEYLDFTLSQGPLILGHNPPAVVMAVEQAAREGQLFAGQHLRELELAELIQRLVPCAELLRFSLSGSEAVHTALRLARAVTGRPRFVRFEGHYHGWLDNVALGVNGAPLEALGPREQPIPIPWSQGLPSTASDEFILLPWNDMPLLEQVLAARHSEVAAIITEPVMCNNSCIEPAAGFLAGLRHLCDRYGIALIFDEVITGFRLGLHGAQGYYDVAPDLAIFAKALANGYPLSALVGREAWMQPLANGTVIHAGTMNASVSTVAAALATLQTLEREPIHARLFVLGQQLIEGLRSAARAAGVQVLIQGPGPMFHLGFTAASSISEYRDTLCYDKVRGVQFVQRMQEQGVRLIGRGLWYLSAAHTPADIESALAAAHTVFREMAQ